MSDSLFIKRSSEETGCAGKQLVSCLLVCKRSMEPAVCTLEDRPLSLNVTSNHA